MRPCLDLIDSLRALGVEQDLALPAIAVIGDQSSGKSSVLEALSGVALPRGSGKDPGPASLHNQLGCPWAAKHPWGARASEAGPRRLKSAVCGLGWQVAGGRVPHGPQVSDPLSHQ